MPIPKPHSDETEDKYISRCISEIHTEYDVEGQAYAVCKGEWDKPTQLAKIPIEIVGDNEEKILEYLPEVKAHETEDAYLARCVIVLYPEYTDEQKGYSLCADKYQRIITVSDKRRANLKTMKPLQNTFEKNRINFIAAIAETELKQSGINLAAEGGKDFPWDECQAKMMDEYGDKDIADKVCGMIKSKYGK